MTVPLIDSRTDWTEGLIRDIYEHIEDIAINDLKLEVYPNQIEIISSEGMLDAYSGPGGVPVNYHHWSFGKDFLKNSTKYNKGHSGLAYEIVIPTNPVTAFIMEENNAITQALVIAHACFGHNSVFKNNFMFKTWTNSSAIIDYMIFAKNYIIECEEKYGEQEVEATLDAAHALSSHGIDKRKRKHKKRKSEEDVRQDILKKEDEKQKDLNIILQTTSVFAPAPPETEQDLDKVDDEENLIYFIYKNAPNMKPWQREILRIVYKVHQLLFPNMTTQTVNEGMATFTHFYIMDQLEQKGLISSDAQIAWLHLHSSVVYQPTMESKHYSGKFNPYALGFDILKEVRRVCENPTAEDKEWFPYLVGKDWRTEVKSAAFDYRDESFIEQFMTPNLMRKYKMMTIEYKGSNGVVTEISDDMGYRNMRSALARQYNMIDKIPDISVSSARMRGDRTLVLQYKPYSGRSLHNYNAEQTMKHVRRLWGYPVELVEFEEDSDSMSTVLYKA
jgi:stage V sporulation protein R